MREPKRAHIAAPRANTTVPRTNTLEAYGFGVQPAPRANQAPSEQPCLGTAPSMDMGTGNTETTPTVTTTPPTEDVATVTHIHPTHAFTVVSFNVNGISSINKRHDIVTFLQNHQPSVLIIQEPKLNTREGTQQQPPKFIPYTCEYFPHTHKNTGIIFYIHPSVMHIRHNSPHPTQDYSPDKKTTTVAFLTVFSEALSQPLVLAGTYLDGGATVSHVKAMARNINLMMKTAAREEGPDQQPSQQEEKYGGTMPPPNPTDKLEVQQSHIQGAGRGLFVKRQIKGNKKVCDYLGEVITQEEFNTRYPDGKAHYVVDMRGGRLLDGRDVNSFGRYANDRKGHNKCEIKIDPQRGTASIWTKKGETLEPGEEVYVSYGTRFVVATQQIPQQPLPPHLLLIGDLNASHGTWEVEGRVASHLGRTVNRHLVSNHDNMMIHKLTCLNATKAKGEYTHVSNTGDRVIDLALTTRPDLVHRFQVLYDVNMSSDHFPIQVTMTEGKQQQRARARRLKELTSLPEPDPNTGVTPIVPHLAWKVQDINKDKMAEAMGPEMREYIDTHKHKSTQTTTLTQEEVIQCWDDFHQRVMRVAHTWVGKKKISNKSKHWWNRQGRGEVEQLHKQYKQAKHDYENLRRRITREQPLTGEEELKEAKDKRDKARNEFRELAHAEKRAAEEEFVASLDSNHKVAWSQYRRAVPKVFTPLAPFPHPGTQAHPESPQEAIDNLASHLAKISTVPQDRRFDTRDDEKIETEAREVHSTPLRERRGLPFTLQHLQNFIPRIRLNTALGTDDISPYFIKYGGEALAEALYLFFEICFSHGYIPPILKHAKVAAIYKDTGPKNDPVNYRPIAVTQVVMRLWEHMMKHTTVELMRRNGIPHMSQFGFTAKRSTYDAIYRFLSTTVDNFKHIEGGAANTKDMHSPAVFVDITKAYDTVWIQGLLYKLKHMEGMNPHLLKFYSNFLLDRTMAVHHSGLMSATHVLLAGVPQGCVLGPFFYTIYIHDIVHRLNKATRLTLFADDMVLQPVGRAGTNALMAMRASLAWMTWYARKWKIKFSATKTNVVFFRPPREAVMGNRMVDPTPAEHMLTLGGQAITTVTEYKYLGVLLDNELTYIPHLQQVIRKGTAAAQMICRLIKRDKLPTFPVIRQLVSSVLIPKITYGFPFVRIPDVRANVQNRETVQQQERAPGQLLRRSTQHRAEQGTLNNRIKRTNNIARQLKNLVIRPLRLALGLPHNAHHHSVLLESRLMPFQWIQSNLAAMTVARWLQMEEGSNAGADQFRKDKSMIRQGQDRGKYDKDHPCRHILMLCDRIQGLQHMIEHTTVSTQPTRTRDELTNAPSANQQNTTATLPHTQTATLHNPRDPVPIPNEATIASHELKHLCVYTDGASRGNPGPAACGGVIYRRQDKLGPATPATAAPIHSFAASLGIMTNNEAEYRGLLMGIEEAIKLGATDVSAYVDSQLVCRQVNREYSTHHATMRILNEKCRHLTAQLQHFTIEHTVRAHNSEADEQCNMVLDSLRAEAPPTTRLPKPVDVVWLDFCKIWHRDQNRSLTHHYPTHNIKRQALPSYLNHDPPEVATKRARLRFRRALFGFNNNRLKYRDTNPHCDHEACARVEKQEDTQHVLMECPRHARDRDKLEECMATLATAVGVRPTPLTLQTLLDPASNRQLRKGTQQVSHITGRFIMAVHKNKKF